LRQTLSFNRALGAAVFKSIRFFVIAASLAWGATAIDPLASAQFGGTQDMMLEKLRRQQEQVSRDGANQGYRPGPPNSQRPPSQGNGHQGSINNNYYFRFPNPQPYGFGYGNGYSYNNGYGNYYGNPYQNGPLLYPPRVTVVPPGVPLNNDILNGVYSTPLYPTPYDIYGEYMGYRGNGGYAFPPVAPAQPAPAMPLAPPQARAQPQRQDAPPGADDEITRRVAALKPSTEAGRTRSDELIAEGDREFVAQQFRRAAAKYREAIAKAPDYPPGHLRAGHAYIATGDYELAVTYLAMGFELARTIERPDFSITDLYRGNNLAKDQHLEALADAVLRQPGDGGLLFLTGITQHYDGHPLQARDYFRRAAEIPGRHQPYAAMFVPKAPDPAAPKNK
jgi:hypothetical protein